MKFAAVALIAAYVAVASFSTPAASAPLVYTIHPNDQLSVQVFGDASLSQNVTVLPSGDINFPLVGNIHVGGESPEQASVTVANALRKYVRNPHVNVIVLQQGDINVLVLGGVAHPGKIQLTSNGTFTDAVAAAGGLSGTAQTYGDAPEDLHRR
jgi:polysaccharide export outer membrane protein